MDSQPARTASWHSFCPPPKESRGRPESPLVASAEAKSPEKREKESKALFLAFPKESISCGSHSLQQGRPRRFPKGDRKALWSLPQRRNLLRNGKRSKALFLASHKKSVSRERFRPPAGGRGTFPHGKVPKGCRGRPKGACLVAAPGPPVAKLQCTASLAGARPARLTSVPGRATVAFKVGFHFVKAKSLRDPRIRLWRKRGLAQLIPPPAFGRRFIPGVMTRCRYGSATWRRNVPRYRGHAKCVPDTDLVGGETRGNAPFGARGGVRGA